MVSEGELAIITTDSVPELKLQKELSPINPATIDLPESITSKIIDSIGETGVSAADSLSQSVVPIPKIDSISWKYRNIEVVDTPPVEAEQHFGLILNSPEKPEPLPSRSNMGTGESYILCGLFLLFLFISLRFRRNMKFVMSMIRNLISTKTRQNVFDDTVRETSLIILFNILWCFSVGIIGSKCLYYFHPPANFLESNATAMIIGIGFAAGYTLFMLASYFCVGWLFTDSEHGKMWVKGYAASHVLSTPFFFVTALIAICWQGAESGVAITALIIFVTARLIFIWKGYRIFFTQFSSWVLFLCYLCSLEIVPLVLTWRIAIYLEGIIT